MRIVLRKLALIALGLSTFACKGDAPTIQTIEDQVAVVGQVLVLPIVATDPDGNNLSFDFSHNAPDLEGTANVSLRPDGMGVFTWKPLASHLGTWQFDFTASDGRNKDKITISIDVRGAVGEGSEPIFRSPLTSGLAFNVGDDDCIEFDVVVDDADSASVTLTQEPPIVPGAVLDVSSNGLSGTWEWCPRREQLEDSDWYDIRISADDGENPKTVKELALILRDRKTTNSDCPGEGPVIEHEPKDVESLQDVEIIAQVSDDQGLKNPPVLFYTTEQPGDELDLESMSMVIMEQTTGDEVDGTWRGAIPNPVASDESAGETSLFYVISASDDDDDDGTECDHTVDSPDRKTHRITVAHPGSEAEGSGLCTPCSADVQCGKGDDLCLRPAAGGQEFCARACAAGSCPDGFTCSPNTVKSVDGVESNQCIPTAGLCAGGADPTDPSDPSEEDSGGNVGNGEGPVNDGCQAGNNELTTATPIGRGEHSGLELCPSSPTRGDSWYKIEVDSPTKLTASATGSDELDVDLVLVNETGVTVRSAQNGLSASEALDACVTPGTYFLHVYALTKAQSRGYRLTYDTAADESCNPAPTESEGGDCCGASMEPGCADASVEQCVCALDSFCCDMWWDAQCIVAVDAFGCGACNTAATEQAACCESQGTPGCSDTTVEACVCAEDPFCCDPAKRWDDVCVLEVALYGCGTCDGAPPVSEGACCEDNGSPGCEDPDVEACVCAQDSVCCDAAKSWDALCAYEVEAFGCGVCGGGEPEPHTCCEGNDGPGCGDDSIESCVCADDNYCCNTKWDTICAGKVETLGCGTCGGGGGEICTDSCQYANDGLCDDGGPNSDFDLCDYGTDCADCGPRPE